MPASSRGYVNRAVTGNEQISPSSPRADVGIGPYENATEVLSTGAMPSSPRWVRLQSGLKKQAHLTCRPLRTRMHRCSAGMPVPPRIRQGFALPPSPREGFAVRNKKRSPSRCATHMGGGNILPHRPVPGVAGEEAEDGEYLQSAQQHIENQDQFAQRIEVGEVAGGSHSLQARADVVEAAQDG